MRIKTEYDDVDDSEKRVFTFSVLLEKEDVDKIVEIGPLPVDYLDGQKEEGDKNYRYKIDGVIEVLVDRLVKTSSWGRTFREGLHQIWDLQDDLNSPLQQLAEEAE